MKEMYDKIVERFLDHLNTINFDLVSVFELQYYVDVLIKTKTLCDLQPNPFALAMANGFAGLNGLCACKKEEA